jgi:hypothetical protein
MKQTAYCKHGEPLHKYCQECWKEAGESEKEKSSPRQTVKEYIKNSWPDKEEVGMTPEERLKRIAQIIWDVDNRCSAVDGPVTQTLEEMTQDEISEIWELSKDFR